MLSPVSTQGQDWRSWTPEAKLALLGRLREMPTPNEVQWARYQSAPVAFARDVLGDGNLTDGQVAVLNAVRDNKVTIVQSANAVGKTFAAADVALWFLRVFSPSKVITAAAPPEDNLKRLLWGEVETKLLKKPDIFKDAVPGILNIRMTPEWWMAGVAIPMSGTPAEREAKFSGKHSPHLLFIVDEADAVPDEVYKGIEACMSGGHVRLLCMFNPRSASGSVYRMIKAGAQVIVLDAFDHPNVVSGREEIPGAVSRAITVERVNKWSRPETEDEAGARGATHASPLRGNDSEWFTVPAVLDGATVRLDDGTLTPALIGGQRRQVTNPALSYMTLARFPGQAESQLISRSWVEAAQQRWLVWRAQHGDTPPVGVRPIHGQDVAEFGGDSNVACFRYGGWVASFEAWNGVDVLVTGDTAAARAQERNARESFVDATGIGAGVAPQMQRWWAMHPRQLQGGQPQEGQPQEGQPQGLPLQEAFDCRAIPVHVAGAPTVKPDEAEFGLLRDQLWWACREWLRADPGAMLPPDEFLADELCAPRYQVRQGKLKISDKDTLRTILRRSPDRADALCLTFAPTETGALVLW
jgi:hypothetical protein